MEILGNLVHPLKSILVTGELPDSVGDQDDKLPAHQPGLSVPCTQMGEKRHRKASISHVSPRSQWLTRYCRKRCCSSVCSWRGCWRGCWYIAQPAPRSKSLGFAAAEFAPWLWLRRRTTDIALSPTQIKTYFHAQGIFSILLSTALWSQNRRETFLTPQPLTSYVLPFR